MKVPSDHGGDGAELVYRQTGDETVAEWVLAAVSELTETDPMDLEPLFDVVDPEALNELYAPDRGTEQSVPRQAMFQFSGCVVVVYGDGRIAVSRLGGHT